MQLLLEEGLGLALSIPRATVARNTDAVAATSPSRLYKWLKDRKGRTLATDDSAHYQQIVVALSETICLMQEIDEVIEKHGGWPEAISSGKGGDTP